MLVALIVAAIATLGTLDSRIMGMTMIDRPLVMGTLVGLALGDLHQGIIIGASIELLSMGVVGIGAHSAPPDVTIGTALCTAFAITSGKGMEVALVLAIPISTFATSMRYLIAISLNHAWNQVALKKAAQGDTKAMERLQRLGAFNYGLYAFVVVFTGVMLGSPLFEYLIKVTPAFIIGGIKAAAGILPALGFALLMRLTLTKELSPFLFIGFIIVAFSGMSSVGVAIVGAILAALVWTMGSDSVKKEGTLNDNEI
ncbi:MAG: PTS sugar transporter subunit IIC [Bacillota bacterium]|nr:PTS sugar transporter subunit IIC [Bacillota bacterium]